MLKLKKHARTAVSATCVALACVDVAAGARGRPEQRTRRRTGWRSGCCPGRRRRGKHRLDHRRCGGWRRRWRRDLESSRAHGCDRRRRTGRRRRCGGWQRHGRTRRRHHWRGGGRRSRLGARRPYLARERLRQRFPRASWPAPPPPLSRLSDRRNRLPSAAGAMPSAPSAPQPRRQHRTAPGIAPATARRRRNQRLRHCLRPHGRGFLLCSQRRRGRDDWTAAPRPWLAVSNHERLRSRTAKLMAIHDPAIHRHRRIVEFRPRLIDRTVESRILRTFVAIHEKRHIPSLLVGQCVAQS